MRELPTRDEMVKILTTTHRSIILEADGRASGLPEWPGRKA